MLAMPEKPAKHRWTRTEKWLFAAPLLVLLCLFGMTTGKEIVRRRMGWPVRVIKLPGKGPLRLFAVSPAGKIAISRTHTSSVEIYDVTTGGKIDEVPVYNRASSFPLGVSFIGEQHLAVALIRSRLAIWDIHAATISRHIPTKSMRIAVSPDERYLATNYGEIWDMQKGLLKQNLLKGGSEYTKFSPDSKLVAQIGPEGFDAHQNFTGGNVWLWNVATGRRIQKIPTLMAAQFDFSPGNQQIACIEKIYKPHGGAVVSRYNLRAFEVANAKELWKITLEISSKHSPTGVQYSPDGRWLAVSTSQDTIDLRSPKTGQLIGTLRSGLRDPSLYETYFVLSDFLNFTRDGKYLVLRARHEIRIWDMDEVNARFSS